jgi:hypothetical protein
MPEEGTQFCLQLGSRLSCHTKATFSQSVQCWIGFYRLSPVGSFSVVTWLPRNGRGMPNCRVPNVADSIEKLRELNPVFVMPSCRATVIGSRDLEASLAERNVGPSLWGVRGGESPSVAWCGTQPRATRARQRHTAGGSPTGTRQLPL